MSRLQTVSRPDIFQAIVAYDGSKNLFSSVQLPFNDGVSTFDVNMSNNPQPVQGGRGTFRIIITAAEAAEVDLEAAVRVLSGSSPQSPISITAMQVLNILVQQAAALMYPNGSTTRNAIYTDHGKEVKAGLEIWRGFFQSVRMANSSLLVNVDVATGVMYRHGPLIEVASELLGMKNPRALAGLRSDSAEFRQLKSYLHKLRVQQTGKRPRVRQIDGIVCNAGAFRFAMDNGEEITVVEYFRRTYSMRLMHPEMPGIRVRSGAIIPFELCEVISGQLFKRPLTAEMATAVLGFSTVRPDKRFQMISNGVQTLGYNSMYLAHLGINVETNPLEVTGRLISPPTIQYGDRTVAPSNGSWNLVGRQFVEPETIRAWAVVSFADPKEVTPQDVQKFLSQLMDCMRNLGIQVEMTGPPILVGNPQSDITNQMRNAGVAAIKASGNVVKKPDMIIAIISPGSIALRKSIKQFGDVLNDVPTQCIRSDKLPRNRDGRSDQYCNNLLTKINAKLGGVCSRLAVATGSDVGWMQRVPTMIVGADVTHPGPGIQRPSVAGLVASVDMFASRYVSTCSVQEPRSEIIVELKEMMKRAFLDFNGYWASKGKAGIWPHQILFYRDGVSEGEMIQVKEAELPQILAAASQLHAEGHWKSVSPKVTFVVVGKRHHIRFAPRNRQEGDRSGNCPAGFVVDNTITSPQSSDFYKDFYLQSHGGLLGTSRPSHYTVLHDDNGFNINSLQALSFALCHVYARSTRSVSIPAPVYYADIVCARADFHFNPELASIDEVASGNNEFDLAPWVNGFRNAGIGQRRKMYFM